MVTTTCSWHEEPSPSHTPHSSSMPLRQQYPPPSSTVLLQHLHARPSSFFLLLSYLTFSFLHPGKQITLRPPSHHIYVLHRSVCCLVADRHSYRIYMEFCYRRDYSLCGYNSMFIMMILVMTAIPMVILSSSRARFVQSLH